jgi:hypothetical protein
MVTIRATRRRAQPCTNRLRRQPSFRRVRKKLVLHRRLHRKEPVLVYVFEDKVLREDVRIFCGKGELMALTDDPEDAEILICSKSAQYEKALRNGWVGIHLIQTWDKEAPRPKNLEEGVGFSYSDPKNIGMFLYFEFIVKGLT